MPWQVRFRRTVAIAVAAIVMVGAGAVIRPSPAQAGRWVHCVASARSVQTRLGDTYPLWHCPVETDVVVPWNLTSYTPVGLLPAGYAAVLCQHWQTTSFGGQNAVWLYVEVRDAIRYPGWGWLPVTAAGGSGIETVHGLPFCVDLAGFDGWGNGSAA